MTGLDTTSDHIIEIAVLITDGNLNVIAEGPELVLHQPKEVMDAMNEWCIVHHGESGLTKRVLDSKVTKQDASAQIVEFMKSHIPKGVAQLAGNSVHMDARFLSKDMPDILAYLHYRIVDVSTVKELCRRWYPKEYASAPYKKGKHRALDDIKESIAELRYYRENIFQKIAI